MTDVHIDTANCVVPNVARQKRGECIDNVEICEYYDPGIQETQSELAVPILTLSIDGKKHNQSVENSDSWEVLAVLNLESDAVEEFAPGDVAKLQVAASEMVSDLICWRSIRKSPEDIWAWYPLASPFISV